MKRRTFLKKSTALAGLASTFAISGTKNYGQVQGANDRIRVAVVGLKGRGNDHINSFGALKGVEVAAVVDVDQTFLAPRATQIKQKFGNEPRAVQDIREILDDKNIDAVSVASCDHTHALYTVWSCRAGKDVYVEKPCSHNVTEGRRSVQAAEKYKRIVQHGTQTRAEYAQWLNPSKVPHALVLAALRSGKYGKLKIAKGFCARQRASIGFKKPEPPPESLNWDLWLGPAPEQPFHRNLVHYEWHWFWDFGCADIGNLGIHELDICRWMTERSLPKTVRTFGRRYVDEPKHDYKDQAETPTMALTLFDYGDVQLLFEVRGLIKPKSEWGYKVDVEYHTDAGVIRGWDFFPNDEPGKKVKLDVPYEAVPSGNIFQNFIDCVRSRKRDELAADILEGHYTAAHVHTANISYRLGETASRESIRAAFGDAPAIKKSIDDIWKNTNDMLPDLKDPQFVLGPKLQFDGETEKFVDNDAANAFLTRKYRAPYTVPENV